jgi:exonuclease V gamma subunit
MSNLEDITAEVRTFCDFFDLVRGLGAHLKQGQGMPFNRDIILVDGRAQSNWLTHALLNEGGMQVHMNADMMTTRRFSSWLVSRCLAREKGEPMPFDDAPTRIYGLVSPGAVCAEDWRQFNGSEELERLGRPGLAPEEIQAAQIKAEMVRWRLSYRLAGHFRELLRNDPEWIRRAESNAVRVHSTRWTRLWFNLVEQVRQDVGTNLVHEVDVLAALRGDGGRGDERRRLAESLPGRITLVTFGDIPLTVLHVLASLSRSDSKYPVKVVIFHFQPTPGFHLDLGQPSGKKGRLLWLGTEDGSRPETLKSPGVPLLAYAGRFFRQQQQKLCDVFESFGPDHPEAVAATGASTSLLARVQGSIRDFESPPKGSGVVDDTLSIHRCHGPRREVEVLREELLRAFACDENLKQGDVLILSPNPELYAPLLESVLNGRTPRINVRTAAMYGVRNSAFGAATKALIDLPEGRVTANEVLNLLSMRAIQAKHGWSVEQLAVLRKWFEMAPMFWGVDFKHRKDRAGLGVVDGHVSGVGTLEDFIRRIAVGTATGSREFVYHESGERPILPLAGIEGREHLRLASQVLEVLGLLRQWTGRARNAVSLSEWLDWFQDAIRVLPQDDDYLAEYRELCKALEHARRDSDRFIEPITHGLFREIVTSRCEFSAGAGQFLRGAATLAPLRASSVHPAKVVALLGMSDGAFPAQSGNIGPEVARPSDGEVAPGAEETFSLQALRASEDGSVHAFLLLLAAARERLIITFDGYIGDSGKAAAPATPVEMLERLCCDLVGKQATGGFAIRSHGLMEHQLPLNVGDAPPKTFDRVTADVGAAIVTTAGNDRILQPKIKADVESMDDEQWLSLWSMPADFALSELNVSAPQPYYPLSDTEPLEYGTRLVNAIVKHSRDRGLSPDDLSGRRNELYLRGFLPLSQSEADEVFSQALASLVAYNQLMGPALVSPAQKFRQKFWVARGPRVRRAKPRLVVSSETKPTKEVPGEVHFVTDEPMASDNSSELELVAVAFILRRSISKPGQSLLYTRATITGMPPVKRGAKAEAMQPVTVSLDFTSRALENGAQRMLKMRSDIMNLAAHILDGERPLYAEMLADVLKASYFKPDKPPKTPKASKRPKDSGAEDSGVSPPASADPIPEVPANGPLKKFEQKDLTGERGAASKGANRYILPESIDLVKFAEGFGEVFEPGLIQRTK